MYGPKLIILFFLAFLRSSFTQTKTDLTSSNLIGQVKSVIKYSYSNDSAYSTNDFYEKVETFYNQRGNTNAVYFFSKEHGMGKEIFLYDPNGNLIEDKLYHDTVLEWRNIHKYDTENNVIEESSFSREGYFDFIELKKSRVL